MGQRLHASMPWLLENVPAWHVWHWASLVRVHAVDVNWPSAQSVQTVQAVALVVVEKVAGSCP